MKTFINLTRCAFVLICITTFQFTSAQANERAFLLGSQEQFLENIQVQLKYFDKNRNNTFFQLETSVDESLKGKINYIEKSPDGSLKVQGEVMGKQSGSFNIIIHENKTEGNIILPESEKSYIYYTNTLKDVYIKETDINNLLCIGLPEIPISSKINIEKNEKNILTSVNSKVSSLQSLPGGKGCLLLDFNGHYMPAGSGWNKGKEFNAPSAGMSNSEIQIAWEVVAEDYRPFNVNVTTDENVYNSYPENKRMRCVITSDNSIYPGVGGVAYLNSFSNGNDNDRPCWVFTTGVGTSGKYVAEAASHEFGHTLGLGHDGKSTNTYYTGHGSWAPIMGVAYYKPVSQWSKGEYSDATNMQDDLAIISGSWNGVGYRIDLIGNNMSSAKPLQIINNQVLQSENEGIIETTGDIDMFSFNTTGGNIALVVKTVNKHANLHVKATLYDSQNMVIGTYIGNSSNLSEPITINKFLNSGTYYLAITGIGNENANTGYTNYGSLGYYNISGSIPKTTVKDILKETIKIYPSPVRNELNIINSLNKQYEIKIINNLGHIVYKDIFNTALKIDFSNNPGGKYQVLITDFESGAKKVFNIIKF